MSSPDPHALAEQGPDEHDREPHDGENSAGHSADRGAEQADGSPDVRRTRNPGGPARRGPVIAVTGAASGVGAALVTRLAASEEVKQVVAIDERRGDCTDAQWHLLDVRDPAIAEKLRGADVVVHLALDLDLETDPAARTAYNVRGTQTVLTAAAAAGVHRVVLCTSAMVYGALPDNDIPLSEDAELRATAEATGVGDLLEIERLGRRAPRAHPGLNVTVVRPAVLVGGTDTALTRYFESPRLLVVAGSRPTWQFCHVEDLVSALEYAALEKVEGELAVGCEGWLEQEEVEELSGIRRMELPSAVALGAAARLHRIGLTPSPAGDLAYTMHPWVVSVSGLHAAGWRPRWTNEEVLAELLQEVAGRHTVAGRRLGRKDATAAGAAGATVALLGAAAAIRAARRRRGI
ncbi:SDR family oxidoreductase [Streptomyces sp. H27-H1]|uniref:SDR family oxidoreductase n=1 Tax=Streptomyces sp. H27-H1 TaxID=2996461 RepID=UPI00227035AB|nr:SDR family oxidoreductase [Streptomyces sp. H27-H1]MCY0927851.1 SDR family oxidoreductase [Streptomyces sp. H27-H1]